MVGALGVLGVSLVIAACGSSSGATPSTSTQRASAASTSSGAAPATTSGSGTSSANASTATSSCGPKPGVKAAGTPIEVGAINTKQPGADFSDSANMEAALFACVNANGGVNGHPIVLHAEFEQSQPSQIAADAHQLVQSDHVVAMSGNFSLIECAVDAKYWQSLGYKVIAAGIAPECYSTPNYADVNMGARFSMDGAAQYVLGIPGVNKVVVDSQNLPGVSYDEGGAVAIAKAKGLPVDILKENVPVNDASSVALKEVDAAGPDGAIVLNFTPPDALSILKAAQKLGLENRVKAWACDTPCNTDFLAKSLGPKWVGRLFVNSELNPTDDPHPSTPQLKLYEAVYNQYGKSTVSGGIGSFSELGFDDGEILVHALQSVHGPYTKANVNKAIEGVKDFDTGLNCVPWTYGPYRLHIANYSDYTVTPNANGQMVLKKGCTAISADDPLAAAYYKVIGRP